jgi:response regulator RpfG family c-di-GMP phosphodiesterase
MNTDALIAPKIVDPEAFQEFAAALADHVPNIEREVAQLKGDPTNKTLISSLFRALHTIKGDAAMCRVEMGVLIVHPVETLLARLRNGDIGFSDVLAEAILLAVDRLELATLNLQQHNSVDQLKLVELVEGLNQLADAPTHLLDQKSEALIEAVTGFRPVKTSGHIVARNPSMPRPETMADDLQFFQSLALHHETRSPLFKGRSERLLRLALETNEVADKKVDATQLEAAIYMHDIGMLFLPESLWLGTAKLGEMDKWMLHEHPAHGAGLLERMPGWQPAADMVRQHHEKQDGSGYPKGLKGNDIVPGAKILAIVDAFESVTLKHSENGERRSVVRAIAEINASDDQFDPVWIAAFNKVIRRIIEG